MLMLALAGAGAAQSQRLLPARCSPSGLALSLGPDVTPATGQHPLAVRFANHAAKACVLFGYPRMEFRDRAGAIPFLIRRRGDQMVTPRHPERVLVRPGRAAFVLLNKYRCDRGDVRKARILRLGLPGTLAWQRASLVLPRGWITYCGRGDPGSTVSVSPFEPTLRAAMRR
jgi:hypothetical protein